MANDAFFDDPGFDAQMAAHLVRECTTCTSLIANNGAWGRACGVEDPNECECCAERRGVSVDRNSQWPCPTPELHSTCGRVSYIN
jgi:hypothetical protein